MLGVGRNPSLRGQLFSYVILGFVFAEAISLFALIMTFLLFYVAYSLIQSGLFIIFMYGLALNSKIILSI